MNTAQPITDEKLLGEIMSVYEYGSKNHLLLAYALNTGLRVSDILTATAGDSKRGHWMGREKKTGKEKVLDLPSDLRLLILDYIEANDLSNNDFLFFNDRDRSKAISRQAADKIIRNAGDMVGVTLSAHSLSKTFGYINYKNKNYDLAELQYLFNHSSSRVTLRYIGVTQESINAKMRKTSIGL